MLQKLTAVHMDACVQLFYEVFTAGRWQFDWLTTDNIRRYFADLRRTPHFIGYVWSEDQRLAGACLGIASDYFGAPQYEIKEIFVDPNRQGRGVGSKFLAAVENDLREKGIGMVILFTSRGIPAYSYYLKNNYIQNEDTVHFMKTL